MDEFLYSPSITTSYDDVINIKKTVKNCTIGVMMNSEVSKCELLKPEETKNYHNS